eukprot:TRINITY_DN1351_c0_g1_i2.p3 TRINITY_DN1351_c0_g1~~TRINITY_DN1351_c0_g1_i2.p3  ORF type:complete len:117 (-),score=11.46 TRINITY_DN1351_c0_g1_i2:322-672(-)
MDKFRLSAALREATKAHGGPGRCVWIGADAPPGNSEACETATQEWLAPPYVRWQWQVPARFRHLLAPQIIHHMISGVLHSRQAEKTRQARINDTLRVLEAREHQQLRRLEQRAQVS